MKVILVGKKTSADGCMWELQGLFTTAERALEAFKDDYHFASFVELDFEAGQETTEFDEIPYETLKDFACLVNPNILYPHD